jgi:hypothetical protein
MVVLVEMDRNGIATPHAAIAIATICTAATGSDSSTRQPRTDEGRRGEIPCTGGAELMRAAHPQRDRHAVPERTDDRAPSKDHPRRRDSADPQTEHEVDAAGDDAFQDVTYWGLTWSMH